MFSFSSLLHEPWEKKRLINVLNLITVLMTILFLFLYWVGRNPFTMVVGYTMVDDKKQFQFLTNIYGDSQENMMGRPMAVAADRTTIYVVDSGLQRVLKFDYTGGFKGKFGSEGEDPGQFKFPYGIAVDSGGRLFIGDIGTGKISIFDTGGKFISYFGSSKDISRPAGIFIQGDQIYVADIGLHRISVFDNEGKLVRAIGKRGEMAGEFNSPNTLFVRDGLLYVGDSGNHRVQVLNILGTFLKEIKFDESGQQHMVTPRGIVADASGNIYVASKITHKVLVFSKEGQLLYTLGAMGNADGELNLPNGLAWDHEERLLVPDTVNQRVVVFAR